MDVTKLESPFTGGPVEVVTETRPYEMRGQTIIVDAQFYKCVDTGELFSTGEQDEAFMAELHRQYRKRNRVPSSVALTARRKALALSAREASRLLGFGVNQFGQYEAGELPSESNTLLLQFFCDPRMLRRLFEERMAVLPAKTVRKLSAACEVGARTPHKSISSMALVGSNWSGPGLYMAVPEHETEAGEKAASFYVPAPHAGASHKLFDGRFFA